MKTTKENRSLFQTRIMRAVMMIFIISLPGTLFASREELSQDSSAIVNYYNPAGSFILQPEAGIRANEHAMKAGLLYDLENKKIVWQKEMNTPFPIASLTKMMVALLAVEDIRQGKIKWTDNVSWTREVIMGRGKRKRIYREAVNYSLLDIFKAAMIASNNEAAEQMARYVGGNIPLFLDRMNTRARELGMNSTYYGNPTGLPAASKAFDNSSTPTDLLILTLEMLKYDEILEVTGMGYADISNGKRTSVIKNHNHLTIDYKGEVDGMKTGYTRRAGFCLVATTNKCNQRLISVVLGAHSPNMRNEAVKDMINDYYSAIGLDKLGPSCEAPLYARESAVSEDYVYMTKTVKQTYVVKQGEDVGAIAYQFNCTPSEIKTWNKLRSDRIAPGRKLTIVSTIKEKLPVVKSNEEDSEGNELVSSESPQPADEVSEVKDIPKAIVSTKTKTKATAATSQVNSKYIIHIVQPGDTLFSIARRYDVDNIAQLKAVNKIYKSRLLKVGSKIKVPVSS